MNRGDSRFNGVAGKLENKRQFLGRLHRREFEKAIVDKLSRTLSVKAKQKRAGHRRRTWCRWMGGFCMLSLLTGEVLSTLKCHWARAGGEWVWNARVRESLENRMAWWGPFGRKDWPRWVGGSALLLWGKGRTGESGCQHADTCGCRMSKEVLTG